MDQLGTRSMTKSAGGFIPRSLPGDAASRFGLSDGNVSNPIVEELRLLELRHSQSLPLLKSDASRTETRILCKTPPAAATVADRSEDRCRACCRAGCERAQASRASYAQPRCDVAARGEDERTGARGDRARRWPVHIDTRSLHPQVNHAEVGRSRARSFNYAAAQSRAWKATRSRIATAVASRMAHRPSRSRRFTKPYDLSLAAARRLQAGAQYLIIVRDRYAHGCN